MRLFSLAVLALAIPITTTGQYGQRLPENPKAYTSPSGQYRLWINPSEPDGTGSAYYKVSHKGEVKWERTLPLTLIEAGITDEGLIGGCALTAGRSGLGDLEIVRIDLSGTVKLLDRLPRRHSRRIHGVPEPSLQGMALEGINDHMMVRTSEESSTESWRTYHLKTGTRSGVFNPESDKPKSASFISGIRQVPNTPLILINWSSSGISNCGAAFSLVDFKASKVWELSLPSDYDIPGPQKAREELQEIMFRDGAILGVGHNRFELRLVKRGQRVTYTVANRGGKWQVKEASSKPFVPPGRADAWIDRLPEVKLQLFSVVTLPVTQNRNSPIRDVQDFKLLGQDRVAFLRGGGATSIVVATLAGKALRESKLPFRIDDRVSASVAWIGSKSAVVIRSDYQEGATSRAWTVDLSNGKVSPLPEFRYFRVEAAAGYSDGSFAVLANEESRHTTTSHLALFAKDGKKVWQLGDMGYSGQPSELLSPEDLAVDSSGQIAVLDVIRHTIQTFDRNGSYRKTIELDKKWGREAEYPTHLTTIHGGGYLLYDYPGAKPTMRLDTGGGIVKSLKQHYPDGKTFMTHADLHLDAQGRIWITDGSAILRLGQDGKVDQTVGPRTTYSGLNSIRELTVTANGNIYAIDSSSGEVHVFDKAGNRKFVARPKTTDFEERPVDIHELAIDRRGHIFIRGGTGDGELQFSSAGARMGYQPISDATGGKPPTHLEPDWRWRGRQLIDGKGKVIYMMNRWPSLDWFDPNSWNVSIAHAPDGRFVTYETEGNPMFPGGQDRLGFYSATGLGLREVSLPKGLGSIYQAAYDGQAFYIERNNYLLAFDLQGKPKWKFKLPAAANSDPAIFASMGGVAVYDYANTVRWYRVK